MTTARRQADETAIRALITDWNRAVEAKDAPAIVAAYTPDTVLYDAIPPGRTVGAEAIAAAWAACFPYFPETFRSEHRDLVVEVDGDVAFAHGMHRFVPEPADHPSGATWMRVTACYRRIDGAWRVVHEHVSVPFDPMSGKAAYIDGDGRPLEPAQPPSVGAVHSVTPHLVCRDAAAAIAFYEQAFGAHELVRLPGPDGRLLHACVVVNGSTVMLCDEFPEMGGKAPTTLHGTPVTIHLPVPDADAAVARAQEAGARVIMPVTDMFWGDRYGLVEDPFGHHWSIATPIRPVAPEDLPRALEAALPGAGDPRPDH
jgi:uncharacterized protein (TIGR02246 family)